MIAILGKSAVGKSTISMLLAKELNLKIISLYTTRPMRKHETKGNPHFFISDSQYNDLCNKGLFNCVMHLSGVPYALASKDCVNDSVCVITQSALFELKKIQDLNIISIYIKSTKENRSKRLAERGDDVETIKKRIISDELDLKDIEKNVNFIVENNTKLNDVVNTIKNLLTKPINNETIYDN